MNEEQKNIETCLAENILSEVANVPTDPQFRSLTDEAIDPSRLQAAAQTGWEDYEKVVWTHKPYTFTSQVKQMKSNLILLLRRLWRFPFGRGTTVSSDAGSSASATGSSAATSAAAPIRSLADMWHHYITRLKGNPEYGIPSRLSQLTDLPSAPALLSDRKISGVPEAPDGISLLHLMTETTVKASVTELVDDDTWDAFGVSVPIYTFPNVSKVTTHVRSVEQDAEGKTTFIDKMLDELDAPDLEYIGVKKDSAYNYKYYYQKLVSGIKSEVVHFPSLRRIYNTSSAGSTGESGEPALGYLPNCKRLLVENLKDIRTSCSAWSGKGTGTQCLADAPECLELITAIEGNTNNNNKNNTGYKFIVAPKLRKFIIGGVLTNNNDHGLFNTTSTDLVHLEIGGSTCSLFMNDWSPTNALDASRTDLIEEGSTAANNLQQFLSNFKTYIAERLTDNGTGLTLTLSQEVRNAIHAAEDEYGIENIIITQKGWTISPAPN